jgi:hypothetical protein
MRDDHQESPTDGSAPARESPAYRIALQLGVAPPVAPRLLRRLGALVLATSVPLLLLSFLAGLAYGERVQVPLLHDPSFYSRFLVALPLLILAEAVVARSLAVQSGYILESGLIPDEQRPRYSAAEEELSRLYNSTLSYSLVISLRSFVAYSVGSSNWERLGAAQGGGLTWAGWWSILVSLPILVFLFLHWFWRTCAWAWFLFRTSRLDLELTPTHPDRAGGLGFLAWGQASFAPVLAAVSSVLSGGFAGQVLYAGESVNSLKYHLAVFVALSLGFLLAPLLVFSRKMARSRFRAVLEFGMLVLRHDRHFDEKWLRAPASDQTGLLGSPDVSSMADIASVFEHVERMRVVPLDHQALIVLFLAAMVPMLPFVASSIPLTDILKDLGVFMV